MLSTNRAIVFPSLSTSYHAHPIKMADGTAATI
jgi:hypothetical protein